MPVKFQELPQCKRAYNYSIYTVGGPTKMLPSSHFGFSYTVKNGGGFGLWVLVVCILVCCSRLIISMLSAGRLQTCIDFQIVLNDGLWFRD